MFPRLNDVHVVNVGIADNANEARVELNIGFAVRANDADAQQRRLTSQRIQDLLTIPVFTAMTFGFYEMAKICAEQSGLDLSTTIALLSSVLAGTGIVCTSETIRNASRRFFETIGHGVEWTAREFPAATGALVASGAAGGAAYSAHQAGLTTFAAEQARLGVLFTAEQAHNLASSCASALEEFVNSAPNTQHPEL